MGSEIVTTEQVSKKPTAEALAGLIIKGDLSKLSLESKQQYYVALASACGLNPATRPFEYLELNSRLVLYVKKEAGDQLRMIHKISLAIVHRERVGDVYMVEVKAATPDGRIDFATGAVNLKDKYSSKEGKYVPQTPDDIANSIMKAETKAKRRATLSICGLGILDESETDTLPLAKKVVPIDEVTKTRLLRLTLNKPLVLGENLKAFGVQKVDELNMEQAGSMIGLLED